MAYRSHTHSTDKKKEEKKSQQPTKKENKDKSTKSSTETKASGLGAKLFYGFDTSEYEGMFKNSFIYDSKYELDDNGKEKESKKTAAKDIAAGKFIHQLAGNSSVFSPEYYKDNDWANEKNEPSYVLFQKIRVYKYVLRKAGCLLKDITSHVDFSASKLKMYNKLPQCVVLQLGCWFCNELTGANIHTTPLSVAQLFSYTEKLKLATHFVKWAGYASENGTPYRGRFQDMFTQSHILEITWKSGNVFKPLTPDEFTTVVSIVNALKNPNCKVVNIITNLNKLFPYKNYTAETLEPYIPISGVSAMQRVLGQQPDATQEATTTTTTATYQNSDLYNAIFGSKPIVSRTIDNSEYVLSVPCFDTQSILKKGFNNVIRQDVQTLHDNLIDLYHTPNVFMKHNFNNIKKPKSFSPTALKAFYEAFSTKVQNIHNGDTETVQTGSGSMSRWQFENRDLSIAIYYYLKNLWDKWLCRGKEDEWTVKNFFLKNFVFIDSFYLNTYDKLSINCDELYNAYRETSKDKSLFSMLSAIITKHGCMMLPVPDFIGFHKSSNEEQQSAQKAMEELFTPYPFNEPHDPNLDNKFVVIYTHNPASSISGAKDQASNRADSYDLVTADGQLTAEANQLFSNSKIDPYGSNTPNMEGNDSEDITTKYGYNVPAFGIAYAKQGNYMFTGLKLGMDNPVMTEQAIKGLWNVALKGADSARHFTFMGQDTFHIFTNYSYSVEVQMLGNAQITPLMYFQLMNVPMWRGTYMIYKVRHSMTPGNMITTITAMKMGKYATPFNKTFFSQIRHISDADAKGDCIDIDLGSYFGGLLSGVSVVNDSTTTTTVGFLSVSGDTNSAAGVCRLVYNKLKSVGLSHYQILGCLVNLYGESGFDWEAATNDNGHYGGGIGAFRYTGAANKVYQKCVPDGLNVLKRQDSDIQGKPHFQKVHSRFGSKKDTDMMFKAPLDCQLDYIADLCKKGGSYGKYLFRDDFLQLNKPGSYALAYHMGANLNRPSVQAALKTSEKEDERWNKHKGKVFKYLGVNDENDKVATTTTVTTTPQSTVTTTPQSTGASGSIREITDSEWKTMIPSSAQGKVSPSQFRLITVPYYNGSSVVTGELVVNKSIAESVVACFTEMSKHTDFIIEKVGVVGRDTGYFDDNTIMRSNWSSAFNYRTTANGGISKHASGKAIDINTRYNPYCNSKGKAIGPWDDGSSPQNCWDKASASQPSQKITKTIVNIWKKHGFKWGGEWGSVKDYQHFEK